MSDLDDLPAILGGPPVRPNGPPPWPIADSTIMDAMRTAFDDGTWGNYHGPHLHALEADLVSAFGVHAAITCASGTLAVEIALRACGVEAGREVILGAYEYEPSFLSIHALGAKPVLVDVDASTAAIAIERIERAITPQTCAILASHLHGGIAPMADLRDLADRHGIRIVEDAAQACGGSLSGRSLGSFGDFGILSFGGSKLLSAGRGGALLCGDARLAQRARLTLSRGIQQIAAMSELQAIVLRPQLVQLAERTRIRSEAVIRLREVITLVPGLTLLDRPADAMPGYYKVGLSYDATAFGLPRERFCQAMRAEGIALDPGFRALHMGRAKSRFHAVGSLESAEKLHQQMILLHHPVLLAGEDAIQEIAVAGKKTYHHADRLRSGASG